MIEVVPHLAISTATVVGLLAAIWLLWSRPETALSHTRRLLIVAAVFYAARGFDWVFELSFFRSLTLITAALIPLMTLLVIEGFMRQHARRWIKVLVAGSACIFVFATVGTALTRNWEFSTALFCYQFVAFASMLYLILTRDKSLLSESENMIIKRIALVLIILFPMLASDFQLLPHPVPMKMSGLAVLIGCWVLLHLHVRQLSSRRVVFELALLATFALAASLFVAFYLSLAPTDTFRIWSMLFAFTMAAAVIVNAMRLRARAGPLGSVTQGLTQAETLSSYLIGLKQRDLGCHILSDRDLIDFSATELLNAFDTEGAVDISKLPADSTNDSMSQSQIRTLLHRFNGTQAYLVSSDPLHIAVNQSNSMSIGPDTELLAAFGLARLIAERDALRSKACH